MNLMGAFELSLLFVCIWGFLAVLLTGQFSTVFILFCIGLLIASYRIRRGGWYPSPLVANITAVLVFVVSGVIFFSTLNLLVATVYLFLFLQITKYATRQNLQESRWCYLISLFHVIGASVITTAITFGIMLVGYIFLILTSLRFYVTAKELEAVTELPPIKANWFGRRTAKLSSTPLGKMPLVPRAALRTSLFLTLLVVLMSSALFSVIPRLQTQNLFQSYGPPPEAPAVSAFAENVEFGSFTEIQYDDGVALFVEPVKSDRPDNIRMRGVALDTFDGKAWKRTNYISPAGHDHEFRPVFTTRLYPKNYTFNVIQPPGITNFLFGDSFPIDITIPRQFIMLVDSRAQSAHLSEMPPKEFQYQVKSMHEDLLLRRDPALSDEVHRPIKDLFQTRYEDEYLFHTTASLSNDILGSIGRRFATEHPGSGPEVPFSADYYESNILETSSIETREFDRETTAVITDAESPEDDTRFRRRQFRPRTTRERLQYYLWKCIRLPEELSTGRVAELAREWTEDAETTFAKAMVIETRLRHDYLYSLTPRAQGNFIDDFLFEVKEGHCEYFATSMAVLLRNLGIPARVVNGYYSSEWNAISGNCTVRNRDAHSWVEAWLGDDYGWMTFDPTPPGGVARRGDRSALLDSMSRVMDAVRVRWYRYVVDYSISDQVSAIRKAMHWRRQIMNFLGESNILGLDSDTASRIELGDFSREIDWRPVALASGVVSLVLFWQGWLWLRRRRRNRMSDIRYYDELLRSLKRHGLSIGHGQTPREFAHLVGKSNQEWQEFERATEVYYQTRYQGKQPEPTELQLISELKKRLKRRSTKKW